MLATRLLSALFSLVNLVSLSLRLPALILFLIKRFLQSAQFIRRLTVPFTAWRELALGGVMTMLTSGIFASFTYMFFERDMLLIAWFAALGSWTLFRLAAKSLLPLVLFQFPNGFLADCIYAVFGLVCGSFTPQTRF